MRSRYHSLRGLPLLFLLAMRGALSADEWPETSSIAAMAWADSDAWKVDTVPFQSPQGSPFGPASPGIPAFPQPAGALSGRIVLMSGGHGWTFNNSANTWYTQRGVTQEMNEDYGNLDQMTLFAAYCLNAGATVVPMRPVGYQTNEVVLDNVSPAVAYSGTWFNSTVSPMLTTNPVQFAAFSPTAAGRSIAFDAANNLHIASSGLSLMRVFAPGGTTTATTTADGTFSVTSPIAEITVTSTNAIATEEGTSAASFIINRAGETNAPLTVQYTLSGSASNGVDYAALSGSITFAAGASSTKISVIPVDDSESEPAESVTLTLNGSPNYTAASPSSATIIIIDNDAPTLSIAAVIPTMYERVTDDYVQFEITRIGQTNAAANRLESTWIAGVTRQLFLRASACAGCRRIHRKKFAPMGQNRVCHW